MTELWTNVAIHNYSYISIISQNQRIDQTLIETNEPNTLILYVYGCSNDTLSKKLLQIVHTSV